MELSFTYCVIIHVLYVNAHTVVQNFNGVFLCIVEYGRSLWRPLKTWLLLLAALRVKYPTGPKELDLKETPTYKTSK